MKEEVIDMMHYDENVSVIMNTLEQYNYAPKTIQMNRERLERLRKAMENKGITTFSPEWAMDWCRSEVMGQEQQPYRLSINRLVDVYEQGRVLASHIKIFGKLSENFQADLDSYIGNLSAYTEGSLDFIKTVCGHFCRFAQIKGATSADGISYDILKSYHQFVKEGGTYRHYETQISGFLRYLAEKGKCRTGYAVFMFYSKSDRCLTLEDLSPRLLALAEKRRDERPLMSADDFWRTIPDFKEELAAQGYGKQGMSCILCPLKLLYPFLDSAGFGYDRAVADIWAEAASGFLGGRMPFRAYRSFDLYDDYVDKNEIFPGKRNFRKASNYGRLPVWCKSEVDRFIEDRRREGRAGSTIRQNCAHISKFCLFLVSEGLESFSELTPGLVKRSIMQNEHLATGTKWSYNYGVREFLIRLELRNVVMGGIHLALPCLCAGSEKIVTVLSEEDRAVIESYCENAAAPIELRDAAILKLGLNTALRAIDVVSLKISDIDWKGRAVRVIQSKTKVEHIHPVDTGTLNAVFRYLRDGRPGKAKSSHIFISTRVPYGPLGSGICQSTLRRAGASVTEFHRLRRTYATDTLKAGATIAETAGLLGQSDTNSIHKYTVLDEERMRLCPLSQAETGLCLEGRYAHV